MLKRTKGNSGYALKWWSAGRFQNSGLMHTAQVMADENWISFSKTGGFPAERSEPAVEVWAEGRARLALAIEDWGIPSPFASTPPVQAHRARIRKTGKRTAGGSADRGKLLAPVQAEISAGQQREMDVTGRSHELQSGPAEWLTRERCVPETAGLGKPPSTSRRRECLRFPGDGGCATWLRSGVSAQ
jgi:hypothetical protein